jgi:nucleoside-diphosphate-sugar epimerase
VFADMTSVDSLKSAFSKSWSEEYAKLPLTVICTAAIIRPSERAAIFYERSSKVNVGGTKNVIDVSKRHGADILITTSSASISVRPLNFWIPPWQNSIKNLFQHFPDPGPDDYRPREQYFGNYAKSKADGELLVVDAATDTFRTGIIRPATTIYGGRKGTPDFSVCEFAVNSKNIRTETISHLHRLRGSSHLDCAFSRTLCARSERVYRTFEL